MNVPSRPRRLAALAGLAAILVLPVPVTAAPAGATAPRVAAGPGDRPATCEGATPAPVNTWLGENLDGGADVDWFQFTVTRSRPIRIVVGALPVDVSVDLYAACDTRIGGSNRSGTTYEEVFRRLAPGAYRVKVTAPAEAAGSYALRIQALPNHLAVLTSTAKVAGGRLTLVGELYNGTSALRYSARVRVTFYSRYGKVLKRTSVAALDRRIERETRSGFRLSVRLPRGFHHYRVTVSSSTRETPDNDPLFITIGSYAESSGRINIVGTARNRLQVPVRAARVIALNRDDRGVIFGVNVASVTPSTLEAGGSGTYAISIASCASHGCTTQLWGQARH